MQKTRGAAIALAIVAMLAGSAGTARRADAATSVQPDPALQQVRVGRVLPAPPPQPQLRDVDLDDPPDPLDELEGNVKLTLSQHEASLLQWMLRDAVTNDLDLLEDLQAGRQPECGCQDGGDCTVMKRIGLAVRLDVALD